jgi:hypothetical protein
MSTKGVAVFCSAGADEDLLPGVLGAVVSALCSRMLMARIVTMTRDAIKTAAVAMKDFPLPVARICRFLPALPPVGRPEHGGGPRAGGHKGLVPAL